MRYYFSTLFMLTCCAESVWAASVYYEQKAATQKQLIRGYHAFNQSSEGEYCVTTSFLSQFNIDKKVLTRLPASDEACIPISLLHQQQIDFAYDEKTQLFAILLPKSILQVPYSTIAKIGGLATVRTADLKDKDDETKWDDGINAAFINYNLAYNYHGGKAYRDDTTRNELSAEMNYGLNLGAWRLRYAHAYQRESDGVRNWLTQYAYASRDIKSIRSQFKVGDTSTLPDIFESYPFRGMMIYSDDRMLPDHLRAFSPRIRGVVETNAEIRIWQNGAVIYHTFVPPGPFELRDVYPFAQDGNLYMTIKEKNGVEKSRMLPYSAMPNLAHADSIKYAFSVGRYRPYHYLADQDDPKFMQGTMTYGLPANLTVYTGMIYSPIYTAMAIGVGRSIGKLGAMSFDYRYSHAKQPRYEREDRGSVFRVRHVKSFFDYGMTISSMVERYPRQDFRSFGAAVRQQHIDWWELDDGGQFVGLVPLQKRYRIESRINQYVNNTDSLYITASKQTHYQKSNRMSSFQVGYSGSTRYFDYGIDYSYYHYDRSDADRRLHVSLTLPLYRFDFPRLRLRYQGLSDFRDQRRQSLTLSGTALTNYNLGYGITLGKRHGGGNTLDANFNYDHNAGSLSAWYSRGKGYRDISVNASGSAIFHARGITLGQALGETNALLYLPDSPAVTVDNQFGVMTNQQGYAVATDLTAYRPNSLTLDEYSLDEGYYLPESAQETIPTEGAIVYKMFPKVELELEEAQEEDTSDEDDIQEDETESEPIPYDEATLDQLNQEIDALLSDIDSLINQA